MDVPHDASRHGVDLGGVFRFGGQKLGQERAGGRVGQDLRGAAGVFVGNGAQQHADGVGQVQRGERGVEIWDEGDAEVGIREGVGGVLRSFDEVGEKFCGL